MKKIIAIFLALVLLLSSTQVFIGSATGVLTISLVSPVTNFVNSSPYPDFKGFNVTFNTPANNGTILGVQSTDTYVKNNILINGISIAKINAEDAVYAKNGTGIISNCPSIQANYVNGVLYIYTFVDTLHELKLDGTDTITFKSGFTTPLGDVLASDTSYIFITNSNTTSSTWMPITQPQTALQPPKILASATSGWDLYAGGGYEYSPSIIINDDDSIDTWFPSGGQGPAVNLFSSGTATPVQISGTQTAAQKFTARWSFCAIQVNAPSWGNNIGNLTLKLYKWNTNYNTTIVGAVIASRTFVNFINNSNLILDMETQDAGDYLWVVSNPTEVVGLYKSAGSAYQGNVNYFNGSVVSDDYIFAIYDASNHYASNSATAIQMSGSNTAAQKFVSNNEFVSISVQAPSWSNNVGNLTLKLYKWNTNYNTTIAGAVIATSTFTNFIDNSYLMLNFSKQLAGTYLWVASNPTETVGLYRVSNSSFTGNVNYFNGSVVSGDYKTRVYETNWDVVRYKRSVDGGHTWTQEAVVLKATPGSADLISCCDPSVVKIGSYYYLGYSSTSDINGYNDHVFISRSTSPTGPFEKWNGSSWGGSTVSPMITYNGSVTGWGAGEPSFVVLGSTIYIYYTWRDVNNVVNSTRVATANANDANWPSTIVLQRTIITKPDDSDQLDVKYIDSYGKFIGVSTGNRISSNSHIEVYESTDGLYFYPAKTSTITTNIQAYCHNVGISGNSSGHINLADSNFIAYAYGQTWGNWPTRLSPLNLTQYSGADIFRVNQTDANSNTKVEVLDAYTNFSKLTLEKEIPLANTNDGTWQFVFADYNRDGIKDLFCIHKQGSTGYTEVHALNGADGYQTWILHAVTVMPNVGSDWTFDISDYNNDGNMDLWCINKQGSMGYVEVNILSGVGSFQTYLVHSVTALGNVGSDWLLKVADYNSDGWKDLLCINKNGSTGYTEVHILSGLGSFQTYLLHSATALPSTNSTWDLSFGDYNNDGWLDLYCIYKTGSSGYTEAYILNCAGNFQTYLLQVVTCLPPTNSNDVFSVKL